SAPCPVGSVLLRGMRSRSPPALAPTSSTCSATSSERRSAPAKPNSKCARPAAQHRERQRGGLLRRPSVLSQQPAQRFLDVAVRRVPRQVVEAVHLADRRQAS